MRRSEREITDRSEIEEILRRAEVVHIGMVDRGEPYVVPVVFAYGDGCIYFHGATEGRKAAALRANPRVCFETYVDYEIVRGKMACQFSAKYRSIIGYGTVSVVEQRDDKVKGLDVLMSRFAEGPFSYNEQALARTAVFRLNIESMTGKKLGA